MPEADPKDWYRITAGQRVQVIKKDAKKGGVLQFGTEVVSGGGRHDRGSARRLAGRLHGRADHARRAARGRFPERMPAGSPSCKAMVPTYGTLLSDDPAGASPGSRRSTAQALARAVHSGQLRRTSDLWEFASNVCSNEACDGRDSSSMRRRPDSLPGLAQAEQPRAHGAARRSSPGMTFYEVLAKSALNKVPGSVPGTPYGWTINPYRGCSPRLRLLLRPADTRVPRLRRMPATSTPRWSSRSTSARCSVRSSAAVVVTGRRSRSGRTPIRTSGRRGGTG